MKMFSRKQFEKLPGFLKKDCGLVNSSRTGFPGAIPQMYMEVSIVGVEYSRDLSLTNTGG